MSLRSFCISAVFPGWFRAILPVLAAALAATAQPRPFRPADLLQWREIVETRIRPDASEVVYTERYPDPSGETYQSRLWLVSTAGGAPRRLTAGPGRDRHPRWSPDGSRIAYLSERTGAPAIHIRAISSPPDVPDPAVPLGSAIPLAFAWSPDGRTLACTARVTEPPSGAAWAPLALLPQLSVPHTRLLLVPAAGGAARVAPLGNLEPSGEPAWMPDGSGLLLALAPPLDPAHPLDGPDIYSLALPAFTLRRLTQQPGPDFYPLPSPDGSRIAWLSREASPQSYVTAKLHVARPDGSRARPLAGALDRDPAAPAWSSDSRTVYFLADDRGQTRVYAARNDGSVRTVLSAPRLRAFSLADNGRAAAVRAPGELVTFPVDLPGTPAVLAAPGSQLLAERTAGAVQAFEYASGPRTIQAWLTLPPGFDPAHKYPLLLDAGDTPRRMCGPAFRLRAQVLAAAGWIVLCANARGAPGYGEEFGSLLRTGFPNDAFDDWMAGVDAAAARAYVDPSRIAISGGLAAAWAIGHTTRFRAAVAHRPIADFTLDVATAPDGFRRAAAWLGAMPWDDPAYYHEHSPIYFAAQFRTPTLILAAQPDPAADELYFALRARKVDSALLRIARQRPRDRVLALEAELGWLGR
ncbi:MAG: S9 family peptidase [Acidobacteria bacterium]|nr:S9 family peptidase [Acidobacteriota bacterium]